MTDIRLDASFMSHHKAKKLKLRLGADGVLALLQLWLFAAVNRPEGRLTDMDDEDVALAAEWNGEPGKFVETLVDLHFLDCCQEVYALHNWGQRQPWIVGAPDRSARAKRAAEARWSDASSMPAVCFEHAPSMQDVHSSNAPLLSLPFQDTYCASAAQSVTDEQAAGCGRAAKPDALQERFERFWAAYPKRRSKGDTLKAWKQLRPDEQLLSTILAAIERAKTSVQWQREAGQFIPYPATWLRARGWEDDFEQNVIDNHEAVPTMVAGEYY